MENRTEVIRLVNTHGIITEQGRIAHDLVLYDVMLNNHFDPKVQGAMSDEMILQCQEKRAELVAQLGLSEDAAKQSKTISRLKKRLITAGFPHWRVIQ